MSSEKNLGKENYLYLEEDKRGLVSNHFNLLISYSSLFPLYNNYANERMILFWGDETTKHKK